MLTIDELKLIDVVREIKRTGFGEFQGSVSNKEITVIRESYTHKLS